MVTNASNVLPGQVRQRFDHDVPYDEFANIHIPFSALREMLEDAVASAVQNRDAPYTEGATDEQVLA
ncbi:hypothetical protein CkaCkLH20_04970 [Colletotrichum karsti]|uniref:Uncharacterized protein n=1 Tax=Colletotrichum karsti TaxID=1095194 RepID=A0A9P6I8F5_9PEZI|nr:uncharacterized protein CkaCkLH20_04970 [Colletotrichum karsti]KAF9877835.1 hypothetical protein CkaCkLH20_04970 [Colletotrichum karsti]